VSKFDIRFDLQYVILETNLSRQSTALVLINELPTVKKKYTKNTAKNNRKHDD